MSTDAESMRDDAGSHAMSDEEKRRDQLLAAPKSVEADAAPRVEVTQRDGITRIDIRDDAAVRPGNPEEDPDD